MRDPGNKLRFALIVTAVALLAATPLAVGRQGPGTGLARAELPAFAADMDSAGPGNDLVLGRRGKDRLLGQAGKDKLIGGPGRDRLRGGAGRDKELE